MMRLLLIIALPVLAAPLVWAGGTDPNEKVPSRDTILQKYPLEQIQEVSNYFVAREEAEPLAKGRKIIPCDPTIKEVKMWSEGVVHSLLDDKAKSEAQAYRKDPKAYAARAKDCSSRCACNAYSIVLSQVESDLGKTPEYKALDALLTAEAKKESAANSLACARKLKWFCESDFQKYLEHQ